MCVDIARDTSRCAVVLPWWPHRVSDEERMSLESIACFAGALEIIVVAPQASCLPPVVHPCRVEVFNKAFFVDAWAYSSLLMTTQFYERLACYEQIVVVQSDVLLLRHLAPLVGSRYPWSYVGAPWITQDPSGALCFMGVGNGGFSLRRTQDFIDVLREPFFPSWPQFTSRSRGLALWAVLSCCSMARVTGERMAHLLLHRGIHEDVFWSKVAPCLSPRFTIAPINDALTFSYETFPRFVHAANHGQIPYGVHGWWRHDADFVRELAGK